MTSASPRVPSDRQRRRTRQTRMVVLAGAFLFAAILAFGAWSGRERPRPDVLHEVTLEVTGLH